MSEHLLFTLRRNGANPDTVRCADGMATVTVDSHAQADVVTRIFQRARLRCVERQTMGARVVVRGMARLNSSR